MYFPKEGYQKLQIYHFLAFFENLQLKGLLMLFHTFGMTRSVYPVICFRVNVGGTQ